MSNRPSVRYPDNYTGYRYDDPAAPLPPITKQTMLAALEAGREARRNPTQPVFDDEGRLQVTVLNPYAGKSSVLHELWSMGYQGRHTAAGQARWDRMMKLWPPG